MKNVGRVILEECKGQARLLAFHYPSLARSWFPLGGTVALATKGGNVRADKKFARSITQNL